MLVEEVIEHVEHENVYLLKDQKRKCNIVVSLKVKAARKITLLRL